MMGMHKSECRKAQEKSGEIGGVKKECFWRVGGEGKNGGTGWSKEGRREVKKFLRDKRGVGSGTD
jgi:hypothetical protein